jgi:GT2 family glycosyltransferase
MLDDVGPLDDTFFMYYEDTDLSWRMRLRGWRIVYEPTAVIEHVHSGSSGEWSPFFIFHVDRNRLFMIIKNGPPSFVLRSFVTFGAMSAAYAARTLLRRLRRGEAGGAAAPGPSRARTQVRVVGSLLRHLPEMLAKRWRIRRGRRVSDADITRWFFPREEWNKRFAR